MGQGRADTWVRPYVNTPLRQYVTLHQCWAGGGEAMGEVKSRTSILEARLWVK